MTKKINEAQVKIDIAGLESDDLETLSRMLALAGQAERPASPVAASVPSIGGSPSLAPIQPLDFDSYGASEPETPELPAEPEVPEAPVSAPVENPLDAAVDSLSADVGDFGGDADVEVDIEEPGEEDFSLGISGQPQLESVEEDEEDEEVIEEDFDFSRMLSLAGLEDDGVQAEEKVSENTFLPDLSIAEESPPQNSTDFGPYSSEEEAKRDGQAKTNGVEGDNFVVFANGDQYFWKRVVQEELDNEPDPEYYDNEGNEHRVHEFAPKAPGTALGDNPLNVYEGEEESVEGNEELEDDSDESVDKIFESLQSKYQKFLGDK